MEAVGWMLAGVVFTLVAWEVKDAPRGIRLLGAGLLLFAAVLMIWRPAKASSVALSSVPPFSYCTSMRSPFNDSVVGTVACFTRNPGGWVELYCITDAEAAALFRAEWCGRSPPAGMPVRGRAMPAVPR